MPRPLTLTIAALIAAGALGGCGRNENAAGSPDGAAPSTEERKQSTTPPPGEE